MGSAGAGTDARSALSAARIELGSATGSAGAGIDARSVQGELHLRFSPGDGRTVMHSLRRTMPWAVQRLLHLDPCRPRLARAVLLNSTAGMFAGDSLALELAVEGGAAVEVTTPAMNRVHAMRSGTARSEVRITVAAGGYLEYLPAPTLLTRDAALDQITRVDVAPGAHAACGEVLAFGRTAHGERHAYRAMRQRLDVRVADVLVLAEELRLTGGPAGSGANAVGGYNAYGSLQLLAPDADLSGLLANVRVQLLNLRGGVAGASLLAGNAGVAVRVLADEPFAVQQALAGAIVTFRAVFFPPQL